MSVRVQQQLDAIEQELKTLSWWESEPPSAQALASIQPFAIDTLTFSQWLQFILLARLQAIIDANMSLPTAMSVYPMATESFKGLPDNTQPLIEAIAQLDEAITGQPVARSL